MTRSGWVNFLFVFAFFSSSCTQHAATSTVSFPGLSDLDPSQISTLLIAKNDPSTGSHWSLRLKKDSTAADSTWRIVGGDLGQLRDRFANDVMIRHLLDSLHDLHKLGNALQGPLSSFGLDPPQWELRVDDGNDIRFGAPLKEGGVFALVSGSITGVNGSALALLERLPQPDSLRLRRLSLFDYDDIDEVNLLRKDHKYHWERDPQLAEGFPASHASALRAITDATILRFIDDPAEFERISKALNQFTVILYDRKKTAVHFKFGEVRDHSYVSVSNRENAVFEIEHTAFKNIYAAFLSSSPPSH